MMYMHVSMPAKTNLDKTKAEFSFLGNQKEYFREIYEYDGFKVEDAFNNSLFLEEFNTTVHFKLDLYFLDCAFVFCSIQIDSKEPLEFKLLNENTFLFNQRKELKNIGIKSIGEIYDKLILSRYYNLESFANILDKVDIDMNHAEQWNTFVNTTNENTCIISNRYNFTLSSGNSMWYIEQEESKDSNFLINKEKLKMWKDENAFYFKGDLNKLVKILIHQQVAQSKLSNGIHILENA